MPGVRFDRFLASSAVVLMLSAGAGGAFAEPLTGPAIDAAVPVPDAANVPPPTTADFDRAKAKPSESTETNQTPAATSPTSPATPTAASASPSPTESIPKPETPAPAAAAAASTTPAPAPTSTQSSAETPPPAANTPGTPDNGTTGTTGGSTPAASANPETPSTASTIADANAPIADQLHDLASGKFDHTIGSKKDRVMIDAFYSGRNYAPLWLTDGKPNDRAKAAIAYLGHVDADGLDPADYPVPDFANLTDPTALADAELRLSMAVISYAHHAQIGRVHWSRVSADIAYDQQAPAPVDVLANLAEAKDTAAALDGYEPHAEAYLALKAKLAELRAGNGDKGKPPLPGGPVLKVGDQDDRVAELRDRLDIADDGKTGTTIGTTTGGTTYDKALSAAVKKFQQSHDLKPTGTLTAATIDALNGRQPDRPIDIVLANMERWRWMPHELGKTYVMVNLPDFTLHVIHNDKQVWVTRIVIGKPAMPTPIMAAEMKFITINPTWNVPPSIVNNEYLPALQQDPTVLERMGLVVDHNPDGSIHIYQPPGDKNALGRVRFNFPNKFLVYQHDTPDKYMFALDKRAFSHGCMRVQDPVKYAEVLLSIVRPGDGYTEDRIRRMFGPNESDIQFPTFIPVYLTYQTAFVDDAGKLQFRDDVYGRDKALVALLKGDDRKVADIPIEHREDITHRQVMAIPDEPSLFGGFGRGRNYYPGRSDGEGFFAHLFGPTSTTPPAPIRPPHGTAKPRRETRSRESVER
jgi:L,D-transpeptidase YcbB